MPTVSGTVTDSQGNTAPWSASWTVDTTSSTGIPGMPPAGQVYYGCSLEASDPAAFENGSLNSRRLQPYRKYYQGDDSATVIANQIKGYASGGRIVLASVKFPVSWQSVAAGGDDARMVSLAQQLATSTRPVWLAFHHEPNGNTNTTNQRAVDFRNMYAHLTPIFRQYAADKVGIWLCLNGEPLDSQPSVASQLIPDPDDYDLFGFDRYNAWSPTNGKAWRWPEDALPPIVSFCPPGKRWVVGEYGCRHDPANPQRAVDYLQRFYDWSLANGAAAISYFNSGANSPDGPWTLDGVRLTKFQQLQNQAVTPTTARFP